MQNSQSVLITGCSSGIGLTVAEGLREQGFLVVASARKTADVEKLKQRGLNAVLLDLDDPKSISSGLQATLAITGGRLYALFNNGSFGIPGAVEDLSWQALESQLRTNVLGWHELTRQAIPVMRAQGEGRIIQNSSILGLVSMPFRGAYICSKFALEGLSDTLRLELHGTGIHVSLIEPGPIRSNFRKNARQKYRQYINAQESVHQSSYKAMEERLEKEGDAQPFTLPPEAVLKRVLHALQSKRPKPRYAVTAPAYVFSFLRRILSTRQMDAILRRASGGGSR